MRSDLRTPLRQPLTPVPKIAGYEPLLRIAPFVNTDKTFSRTSTATFIAADDSIESAAVNALRNRDHSNGDAAILIEGSATTLFFNSLSPVTQSVTVVNATEYTVSMKGSGSVTLSGAGTGTVTDGSPVTLTTSSTSLTCTVSGSPDAVQVEEGSTATSFISSGGSATVRAADIATFDMSTIDLSNGFWVVLEGLRLDGVSGGFDRVLQLDDGSNNNRLFLAYSSSTGRLNVEQYSGGVKRASSSAAYNLGDKVNIACRFKANDYASVLPDGTIVTDETCAFTTPDSMYLAANGSAGGSKPARVSYGGVSIYPQNIPPEAIQSALGL